MLTIPRSQELSVYVLPKSRQSKVILSERIDLTTVHSQDGYLRFRAHGTGNKYRLECKHHSQEIESAINNGNVEWMKIEKLRDGRWVAHMRVGKRDHTTPQSLDRVMGIDLGVKVPAVMHFTVRGEEHTQRVSLGRSIRPSDFESVTVFIQSVIDLHGIRLVRLEKFEQDVAGRMDTLMGQYLQEHLQGVQIEEVPRHFTSQCCPQCGQINESKFDRTYHCVYCRWEGDKDEVAARNIMRGGCLAQEKH